MSFVGGTLALASGGPANPLRFSQTRGRILGSPTLGLSYPSPFFDIAHTYLPVTVKQLFRWCRYYFMTNPIINATVFKLSEYPVTDFVVEHEDPQVVRMWTDYLQDDMRLRPFQIECGLDYHTFGNGAVTISYPFIKYLTCPHCGFAEEAKRIRHRWVFTNYTFRLSCPKCETTGDAVPHDFYVRNPSGIRPMRWSVEDIEIHYNDITGESTYFYTIPDTIKNDILMGKKDVVDTIPQIFIQALRQRKGLVFSPDNFFHFKRPTLADQDRGWGTPLILPVLKDTFYLQIMKKAQESILLEHVVPLRILFPQAGSGSSDPYTSVNLSQWREHVANEIARWRHDNNYIPIMPLPLGNQTLGGDGRALLLTQEIQTWSEQIINGMQVPIEFIKGGMSYAGTNVSMRMLENQFINYIHRQRQMANWIVRMVGSYLRWPKVKVRFKPFKMADDIQRKAYLFQLNQAQKISDTTLLADTDLDQREEDELMIRETDKRLESTKKQQLAMAQVQAESQVIMAKSQVKAQQVMAEAQQAPAAPGEPGAGGMAPGAPMGPEGAPEAPQQAPEGMAGVGSPLNAGQQMAPPQAEGGGEAEAAPGAGMDIHQMAQMVANQIIELPPDQQQLALENLTNQSPELAQLVQQYLSSMQPAGGEGGGPQVDMRPLPDQLPPRRVAPPV